MKATRNYIEAITTAIAKDEKITFKEGKGWATDIKNRVLHYPPNDLLQHDIDAVKGFIIHETGHINFTTETPNPILKKHPSINQVYNVLEDLRIENEQIKKYGDFASEPLKTINSMGLLSKIENDGENLKQAPELMQYLHELQGYIIPEALELNATMSMHTVYDLQDKMGHITGEKIHKKVIDTLKNAMGTSNLVDMIKNCRNTEQIKDLAHKYILPYIEDLLDEADKQPDKLKGLEPTKTYGVGYQPPKLYRSKSIPTDNELKALLSPYINTLQRRLVDILKEKSATKWNGNHKQGKLLSKNAYKVLTNDTRIFSKKNNPDKPDYTVTIILDESGSMVRGTKHPNTYISAYLLEQTCKKMGFKVNLIKMDSYPTVIKNLSDYRTIRAGGNSEMRALQEARDMLNKTDDNIVFLLTDGLACDNKNSIKQIIRDLENKYNTTLLAIGIALPSQDIEEMKQVYPNNIQAENPETLPTVMINAMRRLIAR